MSWQVVVLILVILLTPTSWEVEKVGEKKSYKIEVLGFQILPRLYGVGERVVTKLLSIRAKLKGGKKEEGLTQPPQEGEKGVQ